MPGSVSSDLLPGRVLAGRYLLHGAIGTGASGRVYLADDQRLRRKVAVKVLHAALSDDAAFLRRFRAEAQLAASLRHSNIVTVYDWGEDEVPFMVLELLEGGSLRSMLDQGTLLTIAQAARVGRDVASALEYAHARDVLHRDIKPANLLFDEHGVVRVADFGLARALAEASWTEPAGGMLGTARYASPEQATGVQLDARSDLYSLALVLVESVTGRVPFASDTALGMLTARTQRPLIAPDELGPLAAVVDRAGRLKPDERYPDAGTMRQALTDVGDVLSPPSPLVLAGMLDHADPHPTSVAAPAPPPLFDQDAAELLRSPTPEPAREKLSSRDKIRAPRPMGQRRLVPWVVAVVMLAVVALAASAFARVSGASTISVPGLVGRTREEAGVLAKEHRLTVVWRSEASPDPAGVVIDQSPDPGEWTSARQVRAVVSTGPANVKVPEIKGKSWAAVKKALLDAGFVVPTPVQQYNTVFPRGAVMKVTPPAGTEIAPDATVNVVVSLGHAPVNVPDVTKISYPNAVGALTALQFKVKKGQDVLSNDIPKGQVAYTIPRAGRPAVFGSTVVVRVSRGPIMVTVPNLLGLTLPEVEAKILREAPGLAFKINGSIRGDEVVIGEDPVPFVNDQPNSVPLETTTLYLTFAGP